MASPSLSGPYSLTSVGIDNAVTQKSPGVYALGKLDTSDNKFAIHYVGRSEDDLNDRLKKHVQEWYPQFKAAYASSPKSAFEMECELYHDYGIHGDNKVHPARPLIADGSARDVPCLIQLFSLTP
jgi:hypothetical protein